MSEPGSLDISGGLEAFAEQFQAQLNKAGVPGSEHAVHFCLALGLQAAYRFDPGEIVFERSTGHGRIDLWIAPLDLAIEVKFRRAIPSGKNLPATQLFGGLLADLNKVARFDSARRLVVFVTDEPGLAYLQKSAHGLLPLSPDTPTTIRIEDVHALPKSAAVQAQADGTWLPLTVQLVWEKLCGSWRLLAWRVMPLT